MITYKKLYKLLYESPDRVLSHVWDDNDAMGIGIIKDIGFVLKRGNHGVMYNQLYLALRNMQQGKSLSYVLKELAHLKLDVIGNPNELLKLLIDRVKICPWALVNSVGSGAPREIATEALRGDFFNISGRIWTSEKIASFWNTQYEIHPYIKTLEKIFNYYNFNIHEFKFETPEHEGKLVPYEMFISTHPFNKSLTNKMLSMQHTIPEIKNVIIPKNQKQAPGFNTNAEFHNRISFGD